MRQRSHSRSSGSSVLALTLCLILSTSSCASGGSAAPAVDSPIEHDCCNTVVPTPDGLILQTGSAPPLIASTPLPIRIYDLGLAAMNLPTEKWSVVLTREPVAESLLKGFYTSSLQTGRCMVLSDSLGNHPDYVSFELSSGEAVLVDSGVLICVGPDASGTLVYVTDVGILQGKNWTYR